MYLLIFIVNVLFSIWTCKYDLTWTKAIQRGDEELDLLDRLQSIEFRNRLHQLQLDLPSVHVEVEREFGGEILDRNVARRERVGDGAFQPQFRDFEAEFDLHRGSTLDGRHLAVKHCTGKDS